MIGQHGPATFPAAWLRERGLDWAAALIVPGIATATSIHDPAAIGEAASLIDIGPDPAQPMLPFGHGADWSTTPKRPVTETIP